MARFMLCHSPSSGEVFAATRNHWDLSHSVPLPQGDWLHCPMCEGIPLIRDWIFHMHPASDKATVRCRCDVTFKCTSCALVWTHGVALPEVSWEAMDAFPGKVVKRREIAELLGGG